jgi:hypothetical protein
MSLRRSLRLGLLLGALVTSFAASQAAFEAQARAASSRKAKVAVGGFTGDRKGDVRDAFIAALRSDGGYEITDADDVKSTAKARAIAEAAKAMEVEAVITGKLTGNTLKLKVMGADGAPQGDAVIKAPSRAKLKAKIQDSAAIGVADGVDKARASAAEEEEEEQRQAEQKESEVKAEASTADDDDDDDDAPGIDLAPLDAMFGLRALHRTFDFHDTIAEARPNDGFTRFLKYRLPLGPVAFVDLNWYPGAHFAKGQAQRIGLSLGYQKGFAITTKYRAQELQTNEQGFYIGARYRLPIAAHMFGIGASFGQHTFGLDGDEAAPLVPDVKYSYFKLGLDGNLRFGAIALGARVAKRIVLGTGDLEKVWFPGSVKTQSLEFGATVGYRLAGPLEAVVGFDWLRYAFDFNPVQRRAGSESAVAGGAVDQYWSGFLGLRLDWPNESGSAPTAPAAPPPKPDDDE